MKSVWTVARREIRGYFDHPTAYILVIAFLALSLFLTFRSLYAGGMADLRAFFGLLPWLFSVLIPAITMRSLAEEQGRGTLEWLMAHPISEAELVAGKFLGNWAFALVALAGSLPMSLGILLFSDAGVGPVVAQYVGASLLAAQGVGVGLMASSATRNQITAFILAAAISFGLVLAGIELTLMGLPPVIAAGVAQLSVVPHFQNVVRGVIDLRDVLYFISTAGLFLAVAHMMVTRVRLSAERTSYRRLRLGIMALALAIVFLNLVGGRIRGRLDLTSDRLYTLSDGTREILGELDDLVTVKLFVSDELPPEVALTLRDIRDLLADYRRFSGGQLRVIEANPDEDDEAAREAASYGIQALQFNVLREDEFQVRRGWLGMAVLHAGQQEIFPFVPSTDDLEYRLTSAITTMTSESTPTVAFLGTHGARSAYQIAGLQEILGNRYDLRAITVEGDSLPTLSPEVYHILVVAGPTEPLPPQAILAIDSYLEAGGSGLFLLDNNQLSPEAPVTVPLQTGLEEVLAGRGITVTEGVVFDLQSNQPVSMGQVSIFPIIQDYPLWPLAIPAGDHPTTRELEALTLGWASALELADSVRAVPLWTTTEYAGRRPPGGPISPDVVIEAERDEMETQIVAAALLPPVEEGPGSEGGRLVVVGDVNFVDQQFVQGNPQNLVFLANSLDWLAQDERLIQIRSKDRTPPPLIFTSDFLKTGFRWGNLVGVPLVFVLIGLARTVDRRRKSEQAWREVSP